MCAGSIWVKSFDPEELCLMEDNRIIELYNIRDERAIAETAAAYGNYCTAVAKRIVLNDEDAQECVNDTYLGAWNAIPPAKPDNLRTFLGRITRNLSLKKIRAASAEKRGGGESDAVLDELEQTLAGGFSIDEHMDAQEITCIINEFLGSIRCQDREFFVLRYWYFMSVADIAAETRTGISSVKMSLKRTRDRLAERLKKEGVYI